MVTWCCITPERDRKSRFIMEAFAAGWPGAKLCLGEPPDQRMFVTWGQIWLAEKLIKRALAHHPPLPFYQIDNGFYKSAKGTVNGYYRFLYRRPDPIFVQDDGLRTARKIPAPFKPWRKTGEHILLAIPGPDFGRPFGFDCENWHQAVYERLLKLTDRPVKVRARIGSYPLALDLQNAWAVVTHSSNVAVDAVVSGVPVFVEPTASAAPVGNSSLDVLENPAMPDRQDWWDSLMAQQYTLIEMRRGFARTCLRAIAQQVDNMHNYWGADPSMVWQLQTGGALCRNNL